LESSATVKVSDIMSAEVVKARKGENVHSAVRRLLLKRVGCLVVADDGKVVGIMTKGDVLNRAFLKQKDPKKLKVENVMTRPVFTIDPSSTLEEASRLMSRNQVSKLPVVKDGKLVGIITSSDVMRTEPVQVGYLQELVRARFVPHDLR
jgi:CBS domain-containing protein